MGSTELPRKRERLFYKADVQRGGGRIMYDFENHPKDSEAYVYGKRLEVEKIARRLATENNMDFNNLNSLQKMHYRGGAVVELCNNIFKKDGD